MKKTTGLEKACAKALNQFAVNEFFDMLTEVIKEYGILPGNLYNMDKKGIQLGIGVRITAMIDQDQKTVYSIEDNNRELVTVIETICADGSILHPSVIFVRVVPKAWLRKSVGNYAQSPRLNTNGTWLQLIRSCAFLFDSGVPDF